MSVDQILFLEGVVGVPAPQPHDEPPADHGAPSSAAEALIR